MKKIRGVLANIFFVVLLLYLIVAQKTYAQSTYDNNVFDPGVKTVELYNTAKQGSFPIFNLNSSETVTLAFDDLAGGSRNFNYTLEHCDENWNPSDLTSAEYLKGFAEDKIANFSYSTATTQKYTHYSLKLPNENIAPKISGNYIIKVYEDGDQSKMILTRKLYVIAPQITIEASVVPSVNAQQTNQKINFTLNYGALKVESPSGEIHTLVMQNGVTETLQANTDPASIKGNQLVYDDVSTNDFLGGNEFRHFDTRSLKVKTDRILHISQDSDTVVLLTDPDRSKQPYTFEYDLNGNFYVLNQDGDDPHVDADYCYVIFSLSTNRSPDDGTPYILGQFNNFKVDETSKMYFNPKTGKYVQSQFLKQGVYDYKYIWVSFDKPDYSAFEGSHFETENDYSVLVYYQPAGAKYQSLAGYKELNSNRK